MAGQFFLQDDGGGNYKRVLATQVGGGGAANLIPALDASGRLDSSMMPAGIAADTQNVVASEALVAGPVNIYNNAGTLNVRKADCSAANAGKKANGFVVTSYASAATAVVYFSGPLPGLSGLTVGDIFLSTAGTFGAAPTTSGQLVQRCGIAISTSIAEVHFETGVILA